MKRILMLAVLFSSSACAQIVTDKGAVDVFARPPVIMIQLEGVPVVVGRLDAMLINCKMIGHVKPGTKQVNISIDGADKGDGFKVMKVQPDGWFTWQVPVSQLNGEGRFVRAWVAGPNGKSVYLDNASSTKPFKYTLKVVRCP